MVYLNLHNLEVIIHLLNHKVFEPKEQKIIFQYDYVLDYIHTFFENSSIYHQYANVDILDFVYVFQNI